MLGARWLEEPQAEHSVLVLRQNWMVQPTIHPLELVSEFSVIETNRDLIMSDERVNGTRLLNHLITTPTAVNVISLKSGRYEEKILFYKNYIYSYISTTIYIIDLRHKYRLVPLGLGA